MLVLSRRPNEEIVFPNSGIRLRFLGVKGPVVRVGIEAPPEVQVLRGELVSAGDEEKIASLNHALRNRLNRVSLGLHRFYQQWQAGQVAEAEATFQQVLETLEAFDQDWARVTEARPQSNLRRYRTLLVEDDANERELLAGILAMNGCDCQTAADGQDALDYLASHDLPDFVLLDMGLPRLSGPQMLQHIRNEPRSQALKVFAISGADPGAFGVTVGRGGVDAWFQKPLNPRRLWDAIRAENAASASN